MDLVGKVVAITGAKSGIGEALSYEFAKAGAMLVLIARDKKDLVKVAEKAVRLGAKGANTYSADLSKPKDVFELSKNILADFKEINILINNAGVGVYKDIESIDLPDWERSFMVNVIT